MVSRVGSDPWQQPGLIRRPSCVVLCRIGSVTRRAWIRGARPATRCRAEATAARAGACAHKVVLVTEEWVKTTVGGFAEWADRQGVPVDLHGAEILLGLVDDLGLADLGELGSAELRELLLEDLPDQVAAGPGEAGSILTAFGSLVDYFAVTQAVSDEQAGALRAELAGLEQDLTEALEEAGNADQNAAAEILFKMMSDDDVDLDSESAVEDWIQAFEGLPEEEKAKRTEPYLAEILAEAGGMLVPPVRLAPAIELAEAARESRLLIDAVRLADWVGERELTKDEVLSGPDTVAAVAALNLATPRADRELAGAEPRDLDDVPELARLWDAAVAADLIVISGGRARPGSMLASVKDGDREAVLDSWVALLDDVVNVESDFDDEHEHEHDDDHEHQALTAGEAVQDALPGILLHLYEQELATPRAVLAEALAGHMLGAFEVSGKDAREWRRAGEEAFDLELADFAAWGVIEGDESGYGLTRLGVWGVRELLLADGYVAPVVGDLAEYPADVLVAGLVAHREDTADEEIDLWLARREPEAAGREVIQAMAEGSPATRNLASAVLDRLDASAAPAIREGLGDPVTKPYAALWLQQHGDQSALTPAEITWIFIDTVAGLLETTEPADAIATALADAPVEVDLAAMIEEMWRADHPDVADVLEALGDHHPDRDLAKAARRAAYKSRS